MAPRKTANPDAEYITVEPGPKAEADKIILWEVDDAHPDGEISITDSSGPTMVGETARVMERIGDGRLVRSRAKADHS
jgi:hypothetical protein